MPGLQGPGQLIKLQQPLLKNLLSKTNLLLKEEKRNSQRNVNQKRLIPGLQHLVMLHREEVEVVR